jgi:hypothetical protein
MPSEGRYFEAIRIRLLKGRYLDERDARDAPWVVVVNEAMPRRFWPGQNPLASHSRSTSWPRKSRARSPAL